MGKNLNQLDESKYPLFVSFLRENNVYDSYKENAFDISDRNMPYSAILGAFIFVGTKEGHIFWVEISNKWSNYYTQFEDESI